MSKKWTMKRRKTFSLLMKGKNNPNYGGKSQTEETKLKMSLAQKNREFFSEETKLKMSKSHLGKKHSEKTKKKISKANKGRNAGIKKGKPVSEETRLKLSVAIRKAYKKNPLLKIKPPLSKEARKKISFSKIGKPRSEETKKKISETRLRKGICPSKKTRKKMSESQKKRKPVSKETRQRLSRSIRKAYETSPDYLLNRSGKNCHMWRKGIQKEYDSFSSTLKRQIKRRDGYKCKNPFCKNTSNVLMVHHIDYDKKNPNKENLITLCNSCHSATNHNRKESKRFYQNIMKNIK